MHYLLQGELQDYFSMQDVIRLYIRFFIFP